MVSLKPHQPARTQLPTAQDALGNQADFAAWSEAVKRQMLAALQKRQQAN
jgi:hypothetical protein